MKTKTTDGMEPGWIKSLLKMHLALQKQSPLITERDEIFAPARILGTLLGMTRLPVGETLTPRIANDANKMALEIWIELHDRLVAREARPSMREDVFAECRKRWPDFVDYNASIKPFLLPRPKVTDARGIIIRDEIHAFGAKWVLPLFAPELIRLLPPDGRKPGKTAWEKMVWKQLRGDSELAVEWYGTMEGEFESFSVEQRPVAILARLLWETLADFDLGTKIDRPGFLFKRDDGLITANFALLIGRTIDAYLRERKAVTHAKLPDETAGCGVPDPKAGENVARRVEAEEAAALAARLAREVQAFMADDATLRAAWERWNEDPQPTFATKGAEIGKTEEDVRNADRKLRRFLEKFRPTA